MKASELHVKTKELEDFENYEKQIAGYVKTLNDIQTLIREGVEDARCMIGKAHIEVHQTSQWGTTISELASRVNPNQLNLELNTQLSLVILKEYELQIIERIKRHAEFFKVEEDRFKPIFDDYIDLNKHYNHMF